MPKPGHRSPDHYLGIDPGALGGFILLGPGGTIEGQNRPETVQDVWSLVREIAEIGTVVALMERQTGFINSRREGQDGEVKNIAAGHNLFTYGRGYGWLQMALTAAGIPWSELTPGQWMRYLEIPTKPRGMKKRIWKRSLQTVAQTLFPDATITVQLADAVLIAEACRRKHLQR